MFKRRNKISYSTRGRTIEQNNSGKKLNTTNYKTYSKFNPTKNKKLSTKKSK